MPAGDIVTVSAVRHINAQVGIWFHRRQRARAAVWGKTNGTLPAGVALTRMAQPNTASITASVITSFGCPAACDASGFHHDHPIGEHRGQIEVVHDGDDTAAAFAEVLGQPHDGQLMADVEARYRFVQQQEGGARHAETGSQIWQSARANWTRCCSPPESSW